MYFHSNYNYENHNFVNKTVAHCTPVTKNEYKSTVLSLIISYSLHTNTLYTGKTASVGITCFLRSRPTFLLARTIFGVPRKLKTRISSSNNCKMFRATPIAKQPCFCVPIIAKDQTNSYEAYFVSLLNHIGLQCVEPLRLCLYNT